MKGERKRGKRLILFKKYPRGLAEAMLVVWVFAGMAGRPRAERCLRPWKSQVLEQVCLRTRGDLHCAVGVDDMFIASVTLNTKSKTNKELGNIKTATVYITLGSSSDR